MGFLALPDETKLGLVSLGAVTGVVDRLPLLFERRGVVEVVVDAMALLPLRDPVRDRFTFR